MVLPSINHVHTSGDSLPLDLHRTMLPSLPPVHILVQEAALHGDAVADVIIWVPK